MTDQPYSYLRLRTSPLIKRDLVRQIAYGIVVFLLISVIILLAIKTVHYKEIAVQHKTDIIRTQKDFINAGKRFLDYFYSLNAATVEYDHYRALQMITDPKLAKERLNYLIQTDFYRRVRDAQEISTIDWPNSSYKVISANSKAAKIIYTIVLNINRKIKKTAQLTLMLVSVAKSDKYPDGVGVAGWIDTAKEPFNKESK